MQLKGECFRHQEGRLTQRIRIGEKFYFIKQHRGIGWREIFKNLLQLRLPVISAKTEWLAIEKLQSLGIATPQIVGYGEQGLNPAQKKSFILMEELNQQISLEKLAEINSMISFTFKRNLIKKIAQIAAIMHKNGINHRDFYLCHFLLSFNAHDNIGNNLVLYLIDLHRAQIRHKVPRRWLIKDLAGLYFSSKDIHLTRRDYYCFMKYYRNQPLRVIVDKEIHFWNEVRKRGEQLYGNKSPAKQN